MTRALTILLLACATATASPIKAPAGWTTDPKAAVSLSQQLGALPHFGGMRSIVTTEAYRAPQGGALYATRLIVNVSGLDEAGRNRAASAELGELAAAVTRAGTTAISDGGATRSIDASLLEGTQTWHDPATGVLVASRMVIASDNQQMVAVLGECVIASDAGPDVGTSCRAALASLDPDLLPPTRVALAIVAPPKSPTMQPPSQGSSSPSLLDGGERPTLPAMSFPTERETDRRPVYVGIGLVILAAIFWWNRKQREKLEKDFEARDGEPKPEAKPRDVDADDLHAAAEDAKADEKSEPPKAPSDSVANDTKEETA